MPKLQKLLTLEQLADFCEKNHFFMFDSKQMGYTLSVQVDGSFEAEETATQGLLFTKLRVCHTDLNRNKSYISKENMEKAMPSLKYRPILAKIHQLDDGTWDFHGHDMHLVEDENGETHVEYDEQQIGTFTADDPYLEYNEEYDKTYVIATGVIPEEYTKASDIIRRKNGTKVSCELCIDTMSYNAKEKRLELQDFYFSGTTCLGAEKNGTEIGEGMLGSRLDITDFSTENNGVFKEDSQTKMIEALEKLNITLSNFNINGLTINSKEGGKKTVDKLQELLEKYSKTKDDITFEINGLSDEELEAKFAEVFDEVVAEETSNTTTENATENAETTSTSTETAESTAGGTTQTASEDGENHETKSDDTVTETEACGKKKKCSIDENGNMSVNFELSHDDIRYALYNLIEQFDELDNDYYFIYAVYDNYFIMQSWCTDALYGCKYAKDGNNITLDGERYKLYNEILTESEKAELDTMRSKYSAIEAELNTYKVSEQNAQKEALFASTDYQGITALDSFKDLQKESSKYSVVELTEKLDKMIAESVKNGTFSFKEQTETKSTSRKVNFTQTLVSDKSKKKSFLDGLLNK